MTAEAQTHELIATAAFGVEASVKWELARLGYDAKGDQPGRLVFHADDRAIARANLGLRAADRVLMVVGRFEAAEFDALYAGVAAIDWKRLVPSGSRVTVRVGVVRSPITSERAAQSVVKRAIVESLVGRGGVLEESGEELVVDVSVIGTGVTVSLDTSGAGLHKRGYRERAQAGMLKETLASALVMICRWRRDEMLVDPFCGSGTILIEAALLASGRAPGMHRAFAAEGWPWLGEAVWAQAREEAASRVGDAGIAPIVGYDINPQSVGLARRCAEAAGVGHLVRFELADYRELRAQAERGWAITNPPYGLRVGEEREAERIQRDLGAVMARMPGWSFGLLLGGEDFERRVGREATRRRKLYNAKIRCTLYQFEADGREGRASEALPPAREAEIAGFVSAVEKRARHTRRWEAERGIASVRLFEGETLGVPVRVEKFAAALRVEDLGSGGDFRAERMNRVERLAEAARGALELPTDSVWVVHAGASRERAQEAVRVSERGVVYEVRPGERWGTGLEIGLREARRWAAERGAGKRALDVSARAGWLGEALAIAAREAVLVTPDEKEEARVRRNLTLTGFRPEAVRLVRGGALASIDEPPGEGAWDLVLCVLTEPEAREIAGAEADVAAGVREMLSAGGWGLLAIPAAEAEGLAAIEGAREVTRGLMPEDVRAETGWRFWSVRGGTAAANGAD